MGKEGRTGDDGALRYEEGGFGLDVVGERGGRGRRGELGAGGDGL